MGTFHTFGELQQFADKLVKFKQAVLLNVNKGNIPKEHFELAKGGACASFAMGWIAQQFGGKKYYHRAKGIPSKKDTYSADSMMSMLAANSEYMKALTVGDMDIKFLAIDYSLEVVDQAPEAPVDLPFLAREASRAGAGSAIFAWLTIADSATGHAVAYHADFGRTRALLRSEYRRIRIARRHHPRVLRRIYRHSREQVQMAVRMDDAVHHQAGRHRYQRDNQRYYGGHLFQLTCPFQQTAR